jgi:type II secretory pathway pseudopilin PulG
MKTEATKSRSPILVILLAAVAGLAVLCCGVGTVVLPVAIQAGREARHRQEARDNLEQIGLALQNYHKTHAIPAESRDEIEAVPEKDESAGGRELETNGSDDGTQESDGTATHR